MKTKLLVLAIFVVTTPIIFEACRERASAVPQSEISDTAPNQIDHRNGNSHLDSVNWSNAWTGVFGEGSEDSSNNFGDLPVDSTSRFMDEISGYRTEHDSIANNAQATQALSGNWAYYYGTQPDSTVRRKPVTRRRN